MNEITPFQDAQLNAQPPAQQSRTELGQEDFLKLMITQFRNQDPFKPMDNGQFLGQLAQFSTVNGIGSLNEGFAGLASSLKSEQALQAANLVGRNVLAEADAAYIGPGGSVPGAVELESSAANVQIEITDATGQLVRRMDLGEQPAGLVRFEWDGRDSKGDIVPSGPYQVAARVARGNQVEGVATLLEATVESVTLGKAGEGMTLNLPGGGTLSLDQVRRII
jgi:flagellar basal-body rod modification protein FlgD